MNYRPFAVALLLAALASGCGALILPPPSSGPGLGGAAPQNCPQTMTRASCGSAQ